MLKKLYEWLTLRGLPGRECARHRANHQAFIRVEMYRFKTAGTMDERELNDLSHRGDRALLRLKRRSRLNTQP